MIAESKKKDPPEEKTEGLLGSVESSRQGKFEKAR